MEFLSNFSLAENIRLETEQIKKEAPEICENKRATYKPQYFCEICQNWFRKRDQLDRHLFQVHTGIVSIFLVSFRTSSKFHIFQKNYTCYFTDCDKAYSNNSHLKRHIKSVHEKKDKEPERFRCLEETCRQLFTSVSNMHRHHKLAHILVKPYECPECHERFTRKINLKQHSSRHTGIFPYNCQECSRGYVNKRSLEKHQASHSSEYRRSHNCLECSKEFLKWSDLMNHRKLEHAARFECDFCRKKFFSKHNLKHHFQIHKPKDDRCVFQCSFENCPKFYFEKRNLQAHIRSKHEGKKFVCDMVGCGRALSTKQKLEQHMKLHRSSARAIKKPKKQQAKRKDAGQKRLEIEKILNVNLPSSVKEKIHQEKGDEILVILDQQIPEKSKKSEIQQDPVKFKLKNTNFISICK